MERCRDVSKDFGDSLVHLLELALNLFFPNLYRLQTIVILRMGHTLSNLDTEVFEVSNDAEAKKPGHRFGDVGKDQQTVPVTPPASNDVHY